MGDYSIRSFRPGDEEAIARLQRYLWGTSRQKNLAYLKWKYFENPYVQDPMIYLGVRDDQVVAMRAFVGAIWEIPGGGSQPLPCGADLVVHPDHRDRGLYRGLNQYAIEDLDRRGYAHVVDLSANPENYVAATISLGWKPVGSLEILTRRGPGGDRAASMVHRLADSNRMYALARRALRLGRRIRESLATDPFRRLERTAGRAAPAGPIAVSSNCNPLQMAALVASAGPSDRLRHTRDQAYFAWRYRNPRSTYRFVTWGSPEIEGYLVLQNIKGRRRTAIVDWEAPDPDVRRRLLDFVVDHGRLASLRIWGATLETAAREALAARDFAETFNEGMLRYAGRMLTKPLAAAGASADPFAEIDLTSIASWDLRMIYSDAL